MKIEIYLSSFQFQVDSNIPESSAILCKTFENADDIVYTTKSSTVGDGDIQNATENEVLQAGYFS